MRHDPAPKAGEASRAFGQTTGEVTVSYGRLCTQFYDLDKPEAPREALEFYLDCAAGAAGPILEPMCGSGRFLIPILMSGLEIDGVDASRHMLDACRRRCGEIGLAPVLYEQDVARMELPRRYSLVMIPASSFCLLTDPLRIREGLKRIFDHMVSGARLVVETDLHSDRISGLQSGSRLPEERRVCRPDGAMMVLSSVSRYDGDARIMQTVNRYALMKDGKLLETETEVLDVRHYYVDEFTRLLGAVGFMEVRVLKPSGRNPADEPDESDRPDGSDEPDELDESHKTVIVECRKP